MSIRWNFAVSLVAGFEIDSLGTPDLIFQREEEFNIQISQEDPLPFVTVQDVIADVRQKLSTATLEAKKKFG